MVHGRGGSWKWHWPWQGCGDARECHHRKGAVSVKARNDASKRQSWIAKYPPSVYVWGKTERYHKIGKNMALLLPDFTQKKGIEERVPFACVSILTLRTAAHGVGVRGGGGRRRGIMRQSSGEGGRAKFAGGSTAWGVTGG